MPSLLRVHLTLALLCVPAFAQTPAKKDVGGQDFSKEGVIIEQITTKVAFQSDGTYTYEQHVRARVQSDAGVREYGILRFPYQSSVGGVEVQDVRVIKPNGSVVATPLDSIQDVTSEVYREAPMYSDLREKHVAVKGLEPACTKCSSWNITTICSGWNIHHIHACTPRKRYNQAGVRLLALQVGSLRGI